MLAQVALALGLLAVAGDPTTTTTPRQLPPAFQQAVGTGAVEGEGSVGGCNCGNRNCCGPQDFRCHFLTSPCDMHQRMPYWNNERGYYYFRPYHVVHVLKQQDRAASWGGNPNNPYDNRMLDRVHAEWAEDYRLRQKNKAPEELPETPGLDPEMETPEGTKPGETTPPKEEVKPEEKKPAVEPPQPEQGARKSSSRKVAKIGFSQP